MDIASKVGMDEDPQWQSSMRGASDWGLPAWRRALSRRSARVGLIVLAAVILASLGAPLIVKLFGLAQPNTQSFGALNAFGNPAGPSLVHPFGADPLGRDVLSRLLFGGRASLVMAFGAALISVVLGVTIGATSGYFGGLIDAVLYRLTEVALCFPVLFLALGLAASCSTGTGCIAGTVHPGIILVTLVMGLSGWPYLARLVRTQTQSLREREFVQAARVAGVNHVGVLLRDVLPNVVGPISVFAAFALPGNLLFEAALSFLGVGVPQPTATWGSMLADSTDTITNAWWYFLAPTVAIALTAIAFNLVAEGFRDAFDPRRT